MAAAEEWTARRPVHTGQEGGGTVEMGDIIALTPIALPALRRMKPPGHPQAGRSRVQARPLQSIRNRRVSILLRGVAVREVDHTVPHRNIREIVTLPYAGREIPERRRCRIWCRALLQPRWECT